MGKVYNWFQERLEIQAIADESGLPSISFAVGALVLVGAAGLRRRIH